MPSAQIYLILSRHPSQSSIAFGRSSGLHPVSAESCCVYVRAGRPAFVRPYEGVHRSTSLTSSSLLLQQCPACLVRLILIVFLTSGRWPYSCCFVGCYLFIGKYMYMCTLCMYMYIRISIYIYKTGSGLNEEKTLHSSSTPSTLLSCVYSELFYPLDRKKSCYLLVWFGLVWFLCLWHINLWRLFNAKVILQEEQ